MKEAPKVKVDDIGKVVNESDEGTDCSAATTQGNVFEGVLKSQGCPNLSKRLETPRKQGQVPELAERGEVVMEEVKVRSLDHTG